MGDLGQLIMASGEEESFASYSGMGYVSTVKGIPLAPLLVLSAIAVFGGFLGALMFGPIGLLVPFVCGLALLAIKVMCETDNKAMEIHTLAFKAWVFRLKKVSIILTVSPNKVESQHEHFFRRLKKIRRTH